MGAAIHGGIGFLKVVGRALRDTWLILGITLGLFAGLECFGRALSALSASKWIETEAHAARERLNPYANQSWYGPQFRVEARHPYRFDPYRGYWSLPTHSRHLNVDSAGHRITVQPPFDSATARRIFIFGGSTVWGSDARDSFTIASQLAAVLRARGISNVEVVNLGVSGYNATQEANTLLLEIGHGRIPDAALFLDGFNDVSLAIRYGVPGHANGEHLQALIDLGRRGFWAELWGLGRHSSLVSRVQSAVGEHSGPPQAPVLPGLCRPTAEYYRRVTRSVQAIGKEFKFPVLYFQQPNHTTTRKILTPWERTLFDRSPLPDEAVRECLMALDSAMQDDLGQGYFRAFEWFDRDTASMFMDPYSHLTERGNGVVAERMADVLIPLLTSQPGPGDTRPSSGDGRW